MRHVGSRSLVLLLVATLAGGAASSASAAGGDRGASAAKAAKARRGKPYRKPFKKNASPITDGPLVDLMGRQHLDANAYRDISKAGQYLLEKYPPKDHFFIGLGRDPAPIIAFLQNLGGEQLAINFPASSNESSRATPEILATYVEKLVPAAVLTSGRTIVFVDATTSGRALDLYVPRITPALKGAKVIKAAFAVQFGGSRRYAIFTNPGDKQVIDTTPFPEVNRFFTEPYENVVAEYPRHGPGTHPMSDIAKPLPQYREFRAALMKRMERDNELDDFLGKDGSFFADR